MRLLHVADVHLERAFKWLGPERGKERRGQLRATFRRVVDLARQRDVDALCIAGDLFERENAPPAVGEFLRATLGALGDRPVLIAPGNHDHLSRGCLYDQIRWPANVHVFHSEVPTPVPVADGVVWGAAFAGPERHGCPLAGFQAPSAGLHVALLHADVVAAGATSIYGPLPPRDIEASGLRFAMLGHVHAGFVDEARRFVYPGSLEPLDLSEVGPRAALLLDVTRDASRIERIPIAERRILSVEIDVSTISTVDDLARCLAERQADWEHADVKVCLRGVLRGELEDGDVVRRTCDRFSASQEIAARPEEDVASLGQQNTTLGAFVRAARARLDRATSDEDRQYWSDVLRVGLAAFRGHDVALG